MIQEYITYLRNNRNLASNTLEAYSKDLRNFATWAAPRGLRWSTIRQEDIENYLAEQHRAEAAATSINRHLASIRGLFTWAHHRGMLTTNPARWIRAQKTAEKLPYAADEEALTRYLDTPATTDRARTIHALIALLKDTGIRIQEAIDLRIEDVETKSQTMRIHGKGRRERTVYYTQLTIEHCSKTAGQRLGYLIPISSQRTLRLMLSEELKTVSDARIYPHAIRHLFATSLLTAGADINAIAKLLGHKSVKTTERYATLSDNATRAQYLQYH